MLLQAIGTISLITAFDIVPLSEEAIDWITSKWKAAGITRHDMIKSLRDAYDNTISSVQFGLREGGMLIPFGEGHLYNATSGKFNKEFLIPFASDKNLGKSEFNNLTRGSTEYCQILRSAVDEILPREEIFDVNIEDWVISEHSQYRAEDIQKLSEGVESDLIGRVSKVEGIPPLFFAFLKYKHLLSGSMMFFFCDMIKSDERIHTILTHIDLQKMRKKRNHRHRDQVIRLRAAFV